MNILSILPHSAGEPFFPNIEKQTYEKRIPMPQKSIKAVMDELTAMAQDKNTSPRAFADSFQAHSAELRAVFFPDTPMKMPEAHDDTENRRRNASPASASFLQNALLSTIKTAPSRLLSRRMSCQLFPCRQSPARKSFSTTYTLAEVWTKTRADVFGNWKRFGAKIPRTAASSRNSARS